MNYVPSMTSGHGLIPNQILMNTRKAQGTATDMERRTGVSEEITQETSSDTGDYMEESDNYNTLDEDEKAGGDLERDDVQDDVVSDHSLNEEDLSEDDTDDTTSTTSEEGTLNDGCILGNKKDLTFDEMDTTQNMPRLSINHDSDDDINFTTREAISKAYFEQPLKRQFDTI